LNNEYNKNNEDKKWKLAIQHLKNNYIKDFDSYDEHSKNQEDTMTIDKFIKLNYKNLMDMNLNNPITIDIPFISTRSKSFIKIFKDLDDNDNVIKVD